MSLSSRANFAALSLLAACACCSNPSNAAAGSAGATNLGSAGSASTARAGAAAASAAISGSSVVITLSANPVNGLRGLLRDSDDFTGSDAESLTLSAPWPGDSARINASYHHGQANYCVHFAMDETP